VLRIYLLRIEQYRGRYVDLFRRFVETFEGITPTCSLRRKRNTEGPRGGSSEGRDVAWLSSFRKCWRLSTCLSPVALWKDHWRAARMQLPSSNDPVCTRRVMIRWSLISTRVQFLPRNLRAPPLSHSCLGFDSECDFLTVKTSGWCSPYINAGIVSTAKEGLSRPRPFCSVSVIWGPASVLEYLFVRARGRKGTSSFLSPFCERWCNQSV
jgi:hypothetical protein